MKSTGFFTLFAYVSAIGAGVCSGAFATTATDIYSESITRQMGSAEIPKSFDSNAKEEARVVLAENTANTNNDSASAAMEPVSMETVEQAEQANEPAKVVKSEGRKAPKKVAKKSSKKKKKKKKKHAYQ